MRPQPSIGILALVCAHSRNVDHLLCLRKYLISHELTDHKLLGSQLVSVLVESDSINNSCKIFDNLSFKGESSWNDIIIRIAKSGESQHALALYHSMQNKSLKPYTHTYVALLKACAALSDAKSGSVLYEEIHTNGLLEGNPFLGNAVVDMYVKCGLLSKALEVFNKLSVRDVVSWTTLMTGYIKHGCAKEVLKCFELMQMQGVSPNGVTFVCVLKACGSLGAIDKGRDIHREIERKKMLQTDLIVGNSLIDMYAKSGLLQEAKQVFEELPVRDVVSWTALMTGYVKHDMGIEVLNCFTKMQTEGVHPNSHTYVCILKACGLTESVEVGREIHAEIVRRGLLKNVVVGSALVDMYVKCNLLANAKHEFDELPVRDIIAWNTLITGYVKKDHGKEALNCFRKMQEAKVSPNIATYVSVLKACGIIKDINIGQDIHAEISKQGSLETDMLIGCALIEMYAKFGLLDKAQGVFDKLQRRDVVTWNMLILGYTDQHCSENVLKCFDNMQSEGTLPDTVTFVYVIKACGSIRASSMGMEIHTEIARRDFREKQLFVSNALIDMYVKCGLLSIALDMFDNLPDRDVVSWTALISGFVDHDNGIDALERFYQMQLEGVLPNDITFVCVLKACSLICAISKGQEIHAEVANLGLLRTSPVIGSSVVDMYAKCGLLDKAQGVFDMLRTRDVITWNVLISGYAQHKLGNEALHFFEKMQEHGIPPNMVTYLVTLKACGSIGAVLKLQEIHTEMESKRIFPGDLVVGNTLIDIYGKCGLLIKAQEVFDKLPSRDIVSWNSLIAGYANHDQNKVAIDCFDRLQAQGIIPDAVTFISILKACASSGATVKGEEIHAEIVRHGLLEKDFAVGNALVDMYAKCGPLVKAQELFDKLSICDLVSWNALVTGYAQLGEDEKVFQTLHRMQKVHEEPDLITFTGVLNACCHAGMVDAGESCFEVMSKHYDFSPTLEHYTCIIDLLGRSGWLERAFNVVEKMPFKADIVVWHTLLDACWNWGNVVLGKKAFDHAVMLDDKDAATYLCMRKIYADADMLEDANKIDAMRVESLASKNLEIITNNSFEANVYMYSSVQVYSESGNL